MNKFLFVLFNLLLSGDVLFAQKTDKDSLFIALKDERAMAVHEVKKNESLYSIAQLYSVPAVVLSQNNDITFYDVLEPGRKLLIPMGAYNYFKVEPQRAGIAKSLYYKYRAKDTYEGLGKALDIDERILRDWNKNHELHKSPNGTIFMGWISYGPATNDIISEPIAIVPPAALAPSAADGKKADTVRKGPPTELELIYNYQTSDGQFLDSLSGMVVFFKPQTTVSKDMLYAFSNELARGRVLKVVNPSNGKYVYAKIIGPLPGTKQYINAKIGLDGRARAELETREIKLWCNYFFKY